MKSKNIILLFTLALPLFSCSESQKRVSFSESTTAKSTALKEAFISIPMDIKKKGDILYAGDFKGDSLLYCYSLSEQRFVNQMLPQGQGPDEFLSPVEFFLSDSSAFIHNRWHFTAQNYTFNLELGDIDRPEYTLEEIFQCLIAADKPCIVAIDEFQQIAKYPEKNIEALLRTHIQKIENSNFIFAGSERHMMQEMFLSSSRPFYHSADILELKAIAPEIYIPFIADHFQKRKRHIEIENIEKVYRLFKGHTFYIQKTFNEAFADTPKGKECTLEIIKTAIDNLIAYNDTIFREILSNIPEKQKELLYAIAKVGEAENVTSAKFIKRYSLTSASSVQSATKKLLEKDIITEINKVYSVTDKFFGMWINTIYGNKYTL